MEHPVFSTVALICPKKSTTHNAYPSWFTLSVVYLHHSLYKKTSQGF